MANRARPETRRIGRVERDDFDIEGTDLSNPRKLANLPHGTQSSDSSAVNSFSQRTIQPYIIALISNCKAGPRIEIKAPYTL